jgi:hypothetical protein
MTSALDQVAQVFKDFDLAMDPILDEEQDKNLQGAISSGLAVRLVSYVLNKVSEAEAQGIALSLVRELATMKLQMRNASLS